MLGTKRDTFITEKIRLEPIPAIMELFSPQDLSAVVTLLTNVGWEADEASGWLILALMFLVPCAHDDHATHRAARDRADEASEGRGGHGERE